MDTATVVFAGFLLVGTVLAFILVTLPRWLAPREPGELKSSTYECGEVPIGGPWIRFRVAYYIFALIFVVFDVETVFLYPVGRHHPQARRLRPRRDGRVRRHPRAGTRVRVAQGGARVAVDDETKVLVAPLQPAHGVGARPLDVAADLRHRVLRDRDDDRAGRRATTPTGSASSSATRPRQADCMIVVRHHQPQDGAAHEAALRADGVAQVRHRDGLVRRERRTFRRRLQRGQGRRPDHPRRHLHARAARRRPEALLHALLTLMERNKDGEPSAAERSAAGAPRVEAAT